jgi:hypothetical protein
VEAKREKATGKRWGEKNGLIADEVGSVFSYPPPPCPHHRLILLTTKGRARSKRQGNLSKEAANMPSRRWRNTSLLHHQFLKYHFRVKKKKPMINFHLCADISH